jgi:hypothetical protein
VPLDETTRAWLQTHDIRLRGRGDDWPPGLQTIFAEWDDEQGRLHLGWWADTECPQCGQTNRPQTPSLIDPPGGSWNWQHGCGYWWTPVEVIADPLDDDPAKTIAALVAALDELEAVQEQRVEELRRELAVRLRGFLRLDDDERERRRDGSDTEPGIWRNYDREWEAWAYDPAVEGETITVRERDLPKLPTAPGARVIPRRP